MTSWKPVAAAPIVLAALALAGPVSCNSESKQATAPHDHAAQDKAAQGKAAPAPAPHDHAAQDKAAQATAPHDHAAGGHSGHAAPSDPPDAAAGAPAARDYADAVAQLRARLASLDAIIASGDHDAVHKDCVAAGRLGNALGALAAAPGSPVPQDQVADVTASGKELAAAARSLHTAAHDDDLATVKKDRARMGQLVDSLARHVPQP